MFSINLQKGFAVLSGIAIVSLSLTGCGGGGSNPESMNFTPPSSSEQVIINETNQDMVTATAVDAIGAGLNTETPLLKGNSSSSSFSKYSSKEPMFKKVLSTTKSLKTLAQSGSEECPYGGNITYTATSETSGSGSYNNCQLGPDTTVNGSIKVTGDGYSGTATYTNFSMTDGSETLMAFDSLKYTFRFNSNYDLLSMSMTMNGSATTFDERVEYGNYTFSMDTLNNNDLKLSVNGYIKTPCLNAWLQVTTSENIIISPSASCPTSGSITIGGNASNMNVTFNSDYSADISVNGGALQHYNNCNDLDSGICTQ